MPHGALVLIILIYFIFVTVFLTILWRIALALDSIAKDVSSMAKDVKKLPTADDQAKR